MQDHYPVIIQKTLDYLRSNISQQIKLAEIAKSLGYSRSRLSEIFRSGTGKGIMSQLIDLRIEKAKDLLSHTNLNISEVAAGVGFNSHTAFDIAFSKRLRISPSEFRRRTSSALRTSQTADGLPKSHSWFSDSMHKGLREEHWKSAEGIWKGEPGFVTGTDEGPFRLRFVKLLPENFRLEFEFRLESAYGCPASTAAVSLEDHTATECYSFVLGCEFNTMGMLSKKGVASSLNPAACIIEGQWHKITIILNDDRLELSQDDTPMFHYRDPFPAPYSVRCKLAFWSWRSVIRLRNVRIHDLGFRPMTLATRQGDTLFNSGLYEQARQLYARMEETGSTPADTAELHYKMGMCLLRHQDFEGARFWAGRATLLPASIFWSQQASLALMDADIQQGRYESFLSSFASLFETPSIRDALREKIQAAMQHLLRFGFGETVMRLATQWLDLEENGAYAYRRALNAVIDVLITQNRFEKALLLEQELIKLLRDFPQNRIYPLFTFVDTCNCLGRPDLARKGIEEIRGITRNYADQARAEIYEAICFRTEGLFDKALSGLEKISAKYPKADRMRKFGEMVLSTLLVSLGQIEKAKQALNRAAQLAPDWSYPQKGSRAEYGYPPLLAEKAFAEAAELLLEDSRVEDASAMRAGEAVRAGILFELAGNTERAREVWEEVIRKYPLSRCAYYADLARFLLGKGPDCLDSMPYPVRLRSEMFYLAALLMENRGNLERRRSLLKQSADEDLMNHWPAVLARKNLAQAKPIRPKP